MIGDTAMNQRSISLFLGFFALLTIVLTINDIIKGQFSADSLGVTIPCTAAFIIHGIITKRLKEMPTELKNACKRYPSLTKLSALVMLFTLIKFFSTSRAEQKETVLFVMLFPVFVTALIMFLYFKAEYDKKHATDVKFEKPTKPLTPDEMKRKK